MTTRVGIVLFAHGARDPEWARSLKAIREIMLERDSRARVELAFLEFMSPTLPGAVDALVAEGIARIEVIPVFMAQSGHTKRDLPTLLEAARARHPAIPIGLAAPVGEAQPVMRAIAEYALQAISS